MKMLLTLLIALLCAFGLSACGSNTADTPNKDTQQNQTDNNAGTNSADTDTNVPPEGNVNSQGPDGTAGDGGTVGGDIKMPWTMQEMPSAARWMMSETRQKMQERQFLTQ